MASEPRAIDSAPPIHIWFLAFAFAGLVAAGSLSVTIWDEHQSPDVWMPPPFKSIMGIDQLPAQSARRGPIVIAVGASLTDAAIPPSTIPGSNSVGPITVGVVRLRSAAFTPLWRALRQAHPDLVLVEEDLIFVKKRSIVYKMRLGAYIARAKLKTLLGLDPARDVETQLRPDFGKRVGQVQTQVDAGSIINNLDQIERLRDDGIRVVVIGIPRAESVEKLATNIGARRKLIVAALAERGITYWRPTAGYSDDSYVDYTHMNKRGRGQFRAWLLPRLSDQALWQ